MRCFCNANKETWIIVRIVSGGRQRGTDLPDRVEIMPETFATVDRHLQKTVAKAVILKSLLPEGFKPNVNWLVVDSFDDPDVA